MATVINGHEPLAHRGPRLFVDLCPNMHKFRPQRDAVIDERARVRGAFECTLQQVPRAR